MLALIWINYFATNWRGFFRTGAEGILTVASDIHSRHR